VKAKHVQRPAQGREPVSGQCFGTVAGEIEWLVQAGLPADGSAHGFDKNSDALDISHVNLARYVEAADNTLDMAIATRPTAPASKKCS